MLQNPTLLSPLDFDAHPCGYCGSKAKPKTDPQRDTSHTYGAWAHQLHPRDYRALMDRGWRRSGAYLYKPRMSLTCCPQYTIRLPVALFKPSKQHRQLVNKVRRYLHGEWTPPLNVSDQDVHGRDNDDAGWEDVGLVEPSQANVSAMLNKVVTLSSSPSATGPTTPVMDPALPPTKETPIKPKHKSKNTPFNLREAITDLLTCTTGKHTLRTVLELASNTPTKFALYDKYQTAIHGDAPGKNTPKSFSRFLVDSPLNAFRGSGGIPRVDRADSPLANGRGTATLAMPRYGSFHLCYYLDTRLVGVSVIDVVPGCVSSVYFFYDPEVAWLGLGKVSAMAEATLALEEHARDDGSDPWFVYMGYYVPQCTKMVYKAQFKPSQLLDPVSYRFVTLDARVQTCLDKADKGFTRFDPDVPDPVKRTEVPDEAMDRVLTQEEADGLLVLVQGSAVSLGLLKQVARQGGNEEEDEDLNKVEVCAKKMDAETAQRIVFAI